ncbi:MAG: hypothetical protein Q8N79_07515 [Candidatus Methanoperedens sp.]|nr:hypothetical protein [Candidatus Methanoperedens sp.]
MKTKDVFNASNPRECIQDLDEDALIENVIIPLYQKNNYLLIDRHSHGQGEHGKDIIFKEMDNFPKPVYHAIQAKVVKIDHRFSQTV